MSEDDQKDLLNPDYGSKEYDDSLDKFMKMYCAGGTIAGYEFIDRLHEIKGPCLITSGAIDLCSPYIAKTMYDRISNSKWELFEYLRHMPFVEENYKYMEVLTKWLDAND